MSGWARRTAAKLHLLSFQWRAVVSHVTDSCTPQHSYSSPISGIIISLEATQMSTTASTDLANRNASWPLLSVM